MNGILDDILKELKRAKKIHPNWYDHPAAQAGVVMEEAGHLLQACMQWKYERSESEIVRDEQINKMRLEAIHTAAACIRFLENLKK